MSYSDPYGNPRRDRQYDDGYDNYSDGGGRRDDYDSNINYKKDSNYDDPNQTYNPPPERAEYGGGGRGSDNYYDNYNNVNSYTDDDRSAILTHAQQHGASADDESSVFSHALDFLGGNQAAIAAQDDIDEQAAVGAHQAIYGGGGGEGGQRHSSETMGAGAALQALKMFTGGGGGGSGSGSHGAGGGNNSQAKLIGMAMGQASKLWEEQNGKGNVDPSSSKQNVVAEAGKIALKLYMKSQKDGSSAGLGGGGGSGPGGLLGLAGKFLR